MTITTHPEALTFLADHYHEAWHPWPFFWIFPVLFWLTVITVAILLRRRFRANDGGVDALRTVFARGEITETEYRSRLSILRDTRRPKKP